MNDIADLFFGQRYQVDKSIGAGGMGQVFRATDRLTGQMVALKQVLLAPRDLQFTSRPSTADPAALLLALAHEFRTLASLRHPHIISVLDYGFDAQHQPFFTMELLADAKTLLQAGWDAPRTVQVGLLAQLLEALVYLHRRGVLHHDLKPDNVLVTGGQVRVLDFGLAVVPNQTRASDSFGTLLYLAPEVLDGQPYTVAADLYAMGVLAYELLVGVHPFAADTLSNFFDRVAAFDLDLTPLADRPALYAWVGQLLAADPRARPPSAAAALHALRAAEGTAPPPEDRTIRDSFLQAATFVGRTAELAQLRVALHAALAGQSSTWLVGGESGVGKSRLVEELRAEALVAGALVLRGQGEEGGGAPYQLWRDLARHLALKAPLSPLAASVLLALVPDLPRLLGQPITPAPALDADATRQRLAGVMVDVLQRQPRGVLLVLEDLQWADESLMVLQLIQRRVTDLPMLIVGTYRHDERPALPADLPGAQVIALPRLDPAALAELSAAMLGPAGSTPAVVALLARETEGNAFFAVEVVRALAEDAGSLDQIGYATLPLSVVAGGVQRLVTRRLAQVPDAARPLLDHAAVAGRQINERVLQALIDAQPDLWSGGLAAWLRLGADAAVLEFAEGQWRFAHDKLREGVLAQIVSADLPVRHRAVAEALERVYPDETARAPYIAQLREHWQQGGDAARELAYLVPAVQWMGSVTSDFAATQRLIARGLDLLATTLVSDATASALKLHSWRATILMHQGDQPAAAAVFATALDQADAATYPAARMQLLNRRAVFFSNRAQMPECLRDAEESLQLARQVDDAHGITSALNSAGFACATLGDYVRADAYFVESQALHATMDDPYGRAVLHNNRAVAAAMQGHYAAALPHFWTALQGMQAIGAELECAINLGNIAKLLLIQGAVTTARPLVAEGVMLAERLDAPYMLVPNLLNQAVLARLTGVWADVAAPLARARALIRDQHVMSFYSDSLVEAAWQAWQAGDLAAARALATDGVTTAQAWGEPLEAHAVTLVVSELALAAGDATGAHAALAECLATPLTLGVAIQARALRLQGQLRFAAEDVPAAVADLTASVAHARASEVPPLVVESLARLAVAQARAGDQAATQASMREAATRARDLADLAPLHMEVVLAAAQVAQQAGRTTEATRLAQVAATHPRSAFATRTAALPLAGDRPPPRSAPDLDALLAQLART